MAHILIVDDDDGDIFREAVQELQPSVNCILARSCQEALSDLLVSPSPTAALIFMDINMRGIDGLQCIGEIKKNRSFQDIPIVIYTGSNLRDDRTKAEATGAAYYVEKPNSFTELYKTLQQIFEKEMILQK